MHPTRLQAQRNHEAALRALQIAESGNDLAAWEAAEAAATITRRALVAAELEYPTFREQRREDKILRMRNRGLDC